MTRRILGYTTNDSSLTRFALAQVQEPLQGASPGRIQSWGLGYEQESQVLVRRKPQEHHEVDLLRALADLRTQACVAFSSEEADPRLREENTEPHRFRSWLMVSVGALAGAHDGGWQPAIPELLAGNLKGSTMGERVFFRFLGDLRARGVNLADPNPPIAHVAAALASTLRSVEAAGQGGATSDALLLTNGRALVAGSLGAPLSAWLFRGLEIVHEAEVPGRGRARRLQYGHFRACVVTSGLSAAPEGWEPIEGRQIFAVDETWQARRYSFDELTGQA